MPGSAASLGDVRVSRSEAGVAAFRVMDVGVDDFDNDVPDRTTIPRARSIGDLLRRRPDLVLVAASRRAVWTALLYRAIRPETKLLAWQHGIPPRWHVLQRRVLRAMDGILVSSAADAAAMADLRGSAHTVFTVPGSYDLAMYRRCEPERHGAEARRVAICGRLTANEEAVHVLGSMIRWADANPSRNLELRWFGNGCLRHVLVAQPLPHNLSQSFLGDLSRERVADEFTRCGIMVGTLHDEHDTALELLSAQAMAAGLVVLFDRSGHAGARLLIDQHSGIGFDGAHPDGLLDGLKQAMSYSDMELNALREAARAHVLPMECQEAANRVSRAIEATMRRERSLPGHGGDHLPKQQVAVEAG